MAIPAGSYEFGPYNASLRVETGRSGPAAKAGHDLVIDVRSWSATLVVGDRSSVELSADPTSLHVREGRGGMQALKDDDMAEIRTTIDTDVLQRKPISFASSSVEPAGDGLRVTGALELGGTTKPLSFTLGEDGGTLSASATVTQSDWGIEPYSALFGALKVNDDVIVAVEARLV
jgi:polyisoprenoid-binding protein YceI